MEFVLCQTAARNFTAWYFYLIYTVSCLFYTLIHYLYTGFLLEIYILDGFKKSKWIQGVFSIYGMKYPIITHCKDFGMEIFRNFLVELLWH